MTDHAGGQTSNVEGGSGAGDAAAADAGICAAPEECCPWSGASTSDMVNCEIPFVAPILLSELALFINCTFDSIIFLTSDVNDGGIPRSDSWTVDNREQPTRIILGASLCEQTKLQGVVPIYIVSFCSCIM